MGKMSKTVHRKLEEGDCKTSNYKNHFCPPRIKHRAHKSGPAHTPVVEAPHTCPNPHPTISKSLNLKPTYT